MLWRLMRTFYDGQGLEAWRADDPVPHYVTTSPKVAQAYSNIIRGYLEDVGSLPDFDAREPVYIVELGAGHGRLGYRIVRRLLQLAAGPTFGRVRWVYVLSDLSEGNRASWQAQPRFQPLVAAGVLDFARFDIGNDSSLTLTHSGVVLSPGTVANPLVVVANYIFDSLPQDGFAVRAGTLYERRVVLTTAQPEPDLADPNIVERIDVTCAHEPVSSDYYEDPTWNAILADYRDRLDDAAILLPTGALECVRSLERLASGRALILAGDKGWTRENHFPGHAAPIDFAVHAGRAFSMMVNFDALARYIAQQGGDALLPRRDAKRLVVAALLLGRVPDGHRATRQKYAEEIDVFGPDDFYTLMRGLSDRWQELTPAQICALLQMADADDIVLASCRPMLLEAAASFTDEQRRQLRNIVMATWDVYLPIGEEADRAFQFGTVLYELGYHEEALELFEVSATTFGRTSSTVYNIGACEFALRRIDRAQAAVDEALELDPKYEPARELRLRLESAP